METNLKAGLYLLSTPIGNRGDITIRTLEILKECDLIVSEDTRVARKLLSMYQISLDGRNLVSYSDNSNSYARRKIVESIHNSKSVALISDAGSPLISDPGYKLVCEVISSGADVHSIPGPSSVISALSLSGLPCDKFYFHGFLSSREKKILDELERLRDYSCTAIVFES